MHCLVGNSGFAIEYPNTTLVGSDGGEEVSIRVYVIEVSEDGEQLFEDI